MKLYLQRRASRKKSFGNTVGIRTLTFTILSSVHIPITSFSYCSIERVLKPSSTPRTSTFIVEVSSPTGDITPSSSTTSGKRLGVDSSRIPTTPTISSFCDFTGSVHSPRTTVSCSCTFRTFHSTDSFSRSFVVPGVSSSRLRVP